MTRYTTEELAKAARTTLRAVRLWDNNNLFGSIGRDENGARIFDDSHVRRAKIVSAAQMAGMTLPEIRGASEIILFQKIAAAVGFMGEVSLLLPNEFDL